MLLHASKPRCDFTHMQKPITFYLGTSERFYTIANVPFSLYAFKGLLRERLASWEKVSLWSGMQWIIPSMRVPWARCPATLAASKHLGAWNANSKENTHRMRNRVEVPGPNPVTILQGQGLMLLLPLIIHFVFLSHTLFHLPVKGFLFI